jgi:hypothetical protein
MILPVEEVIGQIPVEHGNRISGEKNCGLKVVLNSDDAQGVNFNVYLLLLP